MIYVRGEQILGGEDKEVRQRSSSVGLHTHEGYGVGYDTFRQLFLAVAPWGQGDRADALATSMFNVCVCVCVCERERENESMMCVDMYVWF